PRAHALAGAANVFGSLAAGRPFAAADDDPQVMAVLAGRFLERAADGGSHTAGMPVKAKDAAERLEPEGIAEPAEKLPRPLIADDENADGAGQLDHAPKEPDRRGPGMQRQ